MIRKLKSGGYRLYSRKMNPKTGRRRNLGTFKTPIAGKTIRRSTERVSAARARTTIEMPIATKKNATLVSAWNQSQLSGIRRA